MISLISIRKLLKYLKKLKMHLFKESHLICSMLTLILYINVIIRGNTLTLQKQKKYIYITFPFHFYISVFSEGIKFSEIDFKLQFLETTSLLRPIFSNSLLLDLQKFFMHPVSLNLFTPIRYQRKCKWQDRVFVLL